MKTMDLNEEQVGESLDRVWALIEESQDRVNPSSLEGALQEAVPTDC